MAQRRMFSPKVTSTDAFLDMPVTARELYFQLGMNADDDGFITPKGVMRMTGAKVDDLRVLISKNFVIPFESGVIVISAWKVNNLVRKDWYQETIYKDEKAKLLTDPNGKYQLVNNSLTEVRLGKDRLLEPSVVTQPQAEETSYMQIDEDGNGVKEKIPIKAHIAIFRDETKEAFGFEPVMNQTGLGLLRKFAKKYSAEEWKDYVQFHYYSKQSLFREKGMAPDLKALLSGYFINQWLQNK